MRRRARGQGTPQDAAVTETLAESVRSVVGRHGYRLVELKTPPLASRRSIDVLAWRHDGRMLHLKIAEDSDRIDFFGQKDLHGVGAVLGSKPLVVSEREGGVELEDGVVYEKNGIPVVNVETLDDVLSCTSDLYVISKRNDFYVRIDGKRLREARIRRGISLGQLAEMLKVTRKTVYEYERESYDVSIDVAEKLVDVLGEEILKPFNIFEEPIVYEEVASNRPDNALEEMVLRVLDELADRIYHAKRAFVDVVARVGNRKLLISVDHAKSISPLESKLEDMERLEELRSFVKVIVTASRALEGRSSRVVRRPSELRRLLLEEMP